MIELVNSEDVATQQISMVIDPTVTIVASAPQYTKDPNTQEWILVTESMPFWSIKKITTSGDNVLIRSANGDIKHNKILTNWNSYIY